MGQLGSLHDLGWPIFLLRPPRLESHLRFILKTLKNFTTSSLRLNTTIEENKMKKLITVCAVVAMILVSSSIAQAEMATAYVGTANANNAFEVQISGNQLYYHPQPDTDHFWLNNNGSAPGTHATYNGEDRDGMKTFACADVAYGQALNTVQLSFDYYTGLDTSTGYNMSGVSMNFFLTDGAGHYGIWSATSGSAIYSDAPSGETDWTRRTLDCTSFVDDGTTNIAIYEHNGFVDDYSQPFTTVGWDQIKDFTIAGFYDYQRTPEGGFEAWNETLWADITNVAVPGDTTLNEYGITLNWGDTVGGMLGDGSGEIGAAAERSYGQAGRMIKNYQITVGATTYDMTFEAGVVPEPSTICMLGFGALSLFLIRRKRNA
jgi:PEP-CTERM motif